MMSNKMIQRQQERKAARDKIKAWAAEHPPSEEAKIVLAYLWKRTNTSKGGFCVEATAASVMRTALILSLPNHGTEELQALAGKKMPTKGLYDKSVSMILSKACDHLLLGTAWDPEWAAEIHLVPETMISIPQKQFEGLEGDAKTKTQKAVDQGKKDNVRPQLPIEKYLYCILKSVWKQGDIKGVAAAAYETGVPNGEVLANHQQLDLFKNNGPHFDSAGGLNRQGWVAVEVMRALWVDLSLGS
ncbi:hypothetical protein M406DRAFT_72891 [Cryphonectria parasitica EP155]|uniref:Uncharacterized protein n=1 Tax=Cryphonectria parasitica (strain ATCC 38755 / EP155) TaxID=660469 RepID=A0A9P5CMI2_CRYP1|nr:uncharacterized protein M406DRAFT_72891 [Cryphonectria parasitica EP155]KAF3762920.1 hypothetical protein M406DRAFT_72891 [Cryphonectria parasitica EP155]